MLFLIIVVPVGLAGLLVLGLCVFHIYLVVSGKTTREQLKGTERSLELRDIDKVLWFERASPLFDPRQMVIVQRE